MQLPGEYADGPNIRPLNLKQKYLSLGTRTSAFTPAHKLSALLDRKSVKRYTWLSYINLYENEVVNLSYFI